VRYQAAPQPVDPARRAAATSGNSTTGDASISSGGPSGTIGRVTRWVCPNCEREFASANQAHVCVPGITVSELLRRHPSWVSEIYQAVIEHLTTLGPVHEDAVNVGIFLKSDRKIASFRPRVRSVLLSLFLPYELTDSRIARALPVASGRIAHMINITSADQVDDQLRVWLSEAYDFNTDENGS
jgi:hypothetical protein